MVIHHSFNGAVTLSLQKFGTLFSCPLADHCFNGAVTLSLQKSVAGCNSTSSAFNGFNGAVTLSLQKFLCMYCYHHLWYVSFNGAVTLSLQKSFLVVWWYTGPTSLQWSCNFIVTEICKLKRINSP